MSCGCPCDSSGDGPSPGLLARGGIACVRFYQNHLSRPLHWAAGPHSGCRFSPSCSAYAIGAIRTHGFFKGCALGAWRILRCNPFCKGGHDPVPPRKP